MAKLSTIGNFLPLDKSGKNYPNSGKKLAKTGKIWQKNWQNLAKTGNSKKLDFIRLFEMSQNFCQFFCHFLPLFCQKLAIFWQKLAKFCHFFAGFCQFFATFLPIFSKIFSKNLPEFKKARFYRAF